MSVLTLIKSISLVLLFIISTQGYAAKSKKPFKLDQKIIQNLGVLTNENGVDFCKGIYYGNNRFLTCLHCLTFFSPKGKVTSSWISPQLKVLFKLQKSLTSAYIDFGYSENLLIDLKVKAMEPKVIDFDDWLTRLELEVFHNTEKSDNISATDLMFLTLDFGPYSFSGDDIFYNLVENECLAINVVNNFILNPMHQMKLRLANLNAVNRTIFMKTGFSIGHPYKFVDRFTDGTRYELTFENAYEKGVINHDIFLDTETLKGVKGHSGSPVFIKGTNKLAGILNSRPTIVPITSIHQGYLNSIKKINKVARKGRKEL